MTKPKCIQCYKVSPRKKNCNVCSKCNIKCLKDNLLILFNSYCRNCGKEIDKYYYDLCYDCFFIKYDNYLFMD